MGTHDLFDISVGDSAGEADAVAATNNRQLKEFWRLPLHPEPVSDTKSFVDFIAVVARKDYWGSKKVIVDPRPILTVPEGHQLSEYLNIIGACVPIENFARQKVIALPAGSTNYFRAWWPDNHESFHHTILVVSEYCNGFLFDQARAFHAQSHWRWPSPITAMSTQHSQRALLKDSSELASTISALIERAPISDEEARLERRGRIWCAPVVDTDFESATKTFTEVAGPDWKDRFIGSEGTMHTLYVDPRPFVTAVPAADDTRQYYRGWWPTEPWRYYRAWWPTEPWHTHLTILVVSDHGIYLRYSN